jgi:hypothetical protein
MYSFSTLEISPRPIGLAEVESASNCVQNRVFYKPISGVKVKPTASTGFMERAMGIEPTSEAWEASILPLYDARSMHYASKTLVDRARPWEAHVVGHDDPLHCRERALRFGGCDEHNSRETQRTALSGSLPRGRTMRPKRPAILPAVWPMVLPGSLP